MPARRGSTGAIVVDGRTVRALNAGRGPVGELVVGIDDANRARPFEDRRYIGRCKACKAAVSALLPAEITERTEHRYGHTHVTRSARVLVWTADGLADWARTLDCSCGARVAVAPVEGVLKPDHVCDARCTSAKGHKCECSCGGLNHGADWS